MRALILILPLAFAVGAASLAQPDRCRDEATALELALYRPEARSEAGARDLLTRTRAALAQVGDQNTACVAQLRMAEMVLLGRSGAYTEMDERLMAFAESPLLDEASPAVRIRYWRQRGFAAERRGEIAESASAYFEAARDASGVGVLDGAAALRDAALSAKNVGRYRLSETYYRAAYELLRDSLTEASGSRRQEILTSLGATYALRTIAVRAEHERAALASERDSLARHIHTFTDRALVTFDEAGAPVQTRDRLGVTLRDAIVWAEHGDAAAAAERLAEARRITDITGAQRPLDVVYLWIASGDVAHETGDFAAAEQWFEQARSEAVRVGSVDSEIEALQGLGRAEEALGDLRGAERAYRQAIDLREIERERIGLREWTASAFAERQRPYRGLSRVLLARDDVRGALQALDASRARAFRDLRRFRQRYRTLDGDRRLRVDALVDSLEALREREARGERKTPASHARIVAYQDSIAQVTGVAPLAAPPLDISALQSHLAAAGRELVVYSLDREQAAAFVVRPDTILAVDLTTTSRRVAERVAVLMAPWLRDRPDPAADLEAAHALYREVFAPVEPHLSDGVPLTIVPDGALTEVPFAMLVRAPAESYREADYLIRHRAFTTDLAAGLVPDPAPTRTERPVVAFGRSLFPGSPLRPLPHVAAELSHVKDHARAHVAIDADATETKLLDAAATAGIVHLATHAVLDAELPMNSYVVLEASDRDDGFLFLHELQNRELSADLVVLSGCSTADGEQASGEGLMGLGYAVRTAGAHASLATLWSVDDRASVALMGAFYRGLADGLAKDEALRRAQLEYLGTHDRLLASPFYWAAPVLSGVPTPVLMPSPRRGWLWGLAALLVSGTLAWRLARSRRSP